MNILHVFGQMGYGGAEMRTLDLMRNVDRERYRFDFCALSGRAGHLEDEIRRLGGDVFHCDIRAPLFTIRFCRFLGRGGYDVVHSHVQYFSGAILMLAHSCGMSGRIAHFRSSRDGQLPTWARRMQNALMKYWIAKHATLILAVGQGAMESSWGAHWAADPRCVVIPNGLDTQPFETGVDPIGVRHEFGIPEGCALVTHVGRMSPPKNSLRLASIMGRLLAGNERCFALFVGKENETIKAAMVDRLSQSGVLDRVRFAGERNDVPHILMGSDLFLFPSLWEGLPGAVLEACAAGTPVLASDIPGVRELARVFPRIQTLDLNVADGEWVRLAGELLAHQPTSAERRSALACFRQTPYDIGSCVAAHVRAWEKCIRQMDR